MSLVKVQGNVSGTGTFTIASPNSNTDRILNLPDSAGTLATAESTLTQFSASGSAPVYACRAWVNFNGTGTVAIRASGNVSSVVDNGTGDYTVNFTTAMPDANFSGNVSISGNSSFTPPSVVIDYGRTPNTTIAPTTTAFRFSGFRASDGAVVSDWEYCNVSIFR